MIDTVESFALLGIERTARLALLATLVDPRLGGTVIGGNDADAATVGRVFAAFALRTGLVERVVRRAAGADAAALAVAPTDHRRGDVVAALRGPATAALRPDDLVVVAAAPRRENRGLWKDFVERAVQDGAVLLLALGAAEKDWRRVVDAVAPWIRPRLRVAVDDDAGAAESDERTAATVRQARRRVGSVAVHGDFVDVVLAAARERGIEGDRAAIQAVRAARAHAALRGADRLDHDDLRFAIAVVLDPRATNEPERRSEAPSVEDEAPGGTKASSEGGASRRKTSGEGGGAARPEETVAPRDASTEIVEARRPGGVRRPGGGEFGRSREVGRAGRARRLPISRRLAIVPTLLAAVERSTGQRAPNGLQVEVRSADLRWREHRMRRGTLFIFVVDASGSMAFHRMSEAKGAVLRALAAAYLRRDEVAFVSVRGERSEILLPPTASMARARAVLERLPIGGGTPLASGLVCAAKLARSERLRSGREPAVAIFTDGRANVALGPSLGAGAETRRHAVRAELLAVAALFAVERIPTTLVDVSSAPGADRFVVEFAAQLGAERRLLRTRDSKADRRDARENPSPVG